MSGTDKTTPLRVAHSRGECSGHGEYPCPCLSLTRRVEQFRRKQTRAGRTKLRADLAHGVDPATTQHRHGGLWDAL